MRMGHLMKDKQVYDELKYREHYKKLEYENALMRKLLIEAKYDLIDWVTAYGGNGCSGEIINDINCFLEGEKYETDKNNEDFCEWVESIITITAYDHLNYPTKYPCYAQMVRVNSGIDYYYTNYLYKEDLIDMLGNINKIIKDSERSTPIRCACEVIDSNCGCSFGQCLNGLIY